MIAAAQSGGGWLPHLNAWPGFLPHEREPEALAPVDERGFFMESKPGDRGRGSLPEYRPAQAGKGASGFHVSVFPDEAVHFLKAAPGKLIADTTVGGAGHTRRILASGALTLGLDQDAEALAHARETIGVAAWDRVALVRTNFRYLRELLDEVGIGGVDGILVDLGVSSHQLDTPGRGFSFLGDGPLDMRMDTSAAQTAADLVNHLPERELADLIFRYGEERASRRIARAIAVQRAARPFRTTRELAACIEAAKPRRGKKTHPATQTFQALRIAVNDELGALEKLLGDSVACLRPGGRLVVITFHSLEDRVVKQFVRKHSAPEVDRPEWPAPRPNPECFFSPVLRKALSPSAEEIAGNPRARSARLRVAERLGAGEKEL